MARVAALRMGSRRCSREQAARRARRYLSGADARSPWVDERASPGGIHRRNSHGNDARAAAYACRS